MLRENPIAVNEQGYSGALPGGSGMAIPVTVALAAFCGLLPVAARIV